MLDLNQRAPARFARRECARRFQAASARGVRSPWVRPAVDARSASMQQTAVVKSEQRGGAAAYWRWALPVAISLCLAVVPPPAGLAQHTWWYFSLFAGVVAALIVEPV